MLLSSLKLPVTTRMTSNWCLGQRRPPLYALLYGIVTPRACIVSMVGQRPMTDLRITQRPPINEAALHRGCVEALVEVCSRPRTLPSGASRASSSFGLTPPPRRSGAHPEHLGWKMPHGACINSVHVEDCALGGLRRQRLPAAPVAFMIVNV